MTVKLGHEGLAETHDFGIGLALGIEVRSPLAPTHRQAGQRILERLFKGEEFQHAFVDARVEADAALVRADGIVVLDSVAALDADTVIVVFPANTKGYHPVRFGNPPQDLRRVIGFFIFDEIENIHRDFLNRLDEFGLPRIAFLDALHECRKIYMIGNGHTIPPYIVYQRDPIIAVDLLESATGMQPS